MAKDKVERYERYTPPPVRQALTPEFCKALKRCPFCGQYHFSLIEWTPRACSIHCDNCSMSGPLASNAERAEAAWNKRAGD